jgi:uncharacterized protein
MAGSVLHRPILSDGFHARRLCSLKIPKPIALQREVPMHRVLPLLFLLTLASVPASAEPVAVTDLYRAETIVTGTIEPERSRGFRVGLTDVVVKLTGDVRLADGDRLAPLLEKPQDLVEWFEYEDRMKDLPVRDEQGTRDRPHFLRMRFKAAELDKALAGLGLSKWAEVRPQLAVWLGVKTAISSFVVTTTARDYGQRVVTLEASQRRGVPVWLPAEDSGVTFEDIAAQKTDKLRSASPKADAWLSGALTLGESGYWDITWQLHWKDQMRSWEKKGVSFDAAIKDGVQTAALIFSGNAGM